MKCDTITTQYPDVGPIETLLPKMQAAAATKDVKTSAEAQMLAARSAAAEMHPSMNLAPFQVQLLNCINIFVVVIVNSIHYNNTNQNYHTCKHDLHRTPVSPSSTQETASVPEFAGLWAQEGAAGVEGGRRLKLTKLEVKMMEEARKKQKENIVQPQVTVVVVVVVV